MARSSSRPQHSDIPLFQHFIASSRRLFKGQRAGDKALSKLPLEGIRVVELTTGAAGPTVARVLCEFGAEVIRCETRLRGDGHRGEDPAKWNKNPDFMKLQRGKKSFTVNMQTDKGRRLVKELVKMSDVLVENYGL